MADEIRRTRRERRGSALSRVGHWGAMGMVLLVASWGVTRGGIIELGKKGQRSTGSRFVVTVDGVPFDDPNEAPGDLAETILEVIRQRIDAAPDLAATTVSGPANAIEITHDDGSDPSSLEVLVKDGGVKGAGVRYADLNQPPLPTMRYHGADSVSTGSVTLTVDTLPVNMKGDSGAVDTVTVSVVTNGKTAAQVNAEIASDLVSSYSFVVTPGAGNAYIATRPGYFITAVSWDTTDPAVTTSDVALPPSNPHNTPTLSAWGLAVLIALLAATALILLRRRRVPAARA